MTIRLIVMELGRFMFRAAMPEEAPPVSASIIAPAIGAAAFHLYLRMRAQTKTGRAKQPFPSF